MAEVLVDKNYKFKKFGRRRKLVWCHLLHFYCI